MNPWRVSGEILQGLWWWWVVVVVGVGLNDEIMVVNGQNGDVLVEMVELEEFIVANRD